MKLGHCPSCATIYRESVLINGRVVELLGVRTLGHEHPGVLSTNYVEVYLLLTDFTITRLSLCSTCRLSLDKDLLNKCFEAVRKHMVMASRSSGAWQQVAQWKNLGWISWHETDDEVRAAQRKVEQTSLAHPLAGIGYRPSA